VLLLSDVYIERHLTRSLPTSLFAKGKGPATGTSGSLTQKEKVSSKTAKVVKEVWITSLIPQSSRVVVMKNARVQGLLAELQACVMESAAPKTLSRYAAPWRQWMAFCVELGGIEPIPAPALEFSLFLLDVAKRSATSSNVKAAKSAASFFHKLAEKPKPGLYPMVITTYASICRRMKTPEHLAAVKAGGIRTGKASVLSTRQLWKLANRYSRHKCLIRRQSFVVFLVSVGGFFRAGELVDGALLMDDIVDLDRPEFGAEQRKVLLIFIETSKTDQERIGAWIPLPYGEQSIASPPEGFGGTEVDCITPGLWLRRFLLSERLGADGNEPVFGIVAAATKAEPQSIRKGTKLSYSRYNEVLKEMGGDIGIPVDNLSAHSGRATGATLAAERGICDRLFKRFGRWKSDRAKDGYVHESIKQMLAVPEALFG
jgi:hypothetical protein